MEKERANLERRKGGELASMLGGPQQGESLEYLRRLADVDRRQAEEGLVALASDGGACYKHIDDLTPEDRPAREAAEKRRAVWLKQRLMGPLGGAPLPP